MMGRIKIHAIVSPPAISRELVDGHHLYVRDAQIYKMMDSINRAIERAFGSKRADVQFVNNR